ncbi:hypothetical protein EF60_23605 [Salmonella enterica]|nr:hypothetical protein [Salmonella enterica]
MIKCLTLYLENVLPVSRWCEHLRGHGGGRASVRQTHARLLSGRYPFVFRTDIRGYYARISKTLLYEQLCRYVSSPVLRDLLHQFYMNASRLQGFRSFDIDGRLQLYIRPCCSHEAAGPYVIR